MSVPEAWGSGWAAGGFSAAEVVESVSKEGESAFQFARRLRACFAATHCCRREPVYGANNWHYAYGQSSQEQILADTEETSSLCSNSQNRPFSVIDMGWEDVDCREGSHWRRVMPGFRTWLAWQTESGILARPGIWACGRCWRWNPWIRGGRCPFGGLVGPAETVLDPTVPDVLERIRGDVEDDEDAGAMSSSNTISAPYDALGRWGFDMVDTITDGGWVFQDRTLTTAEVFLRLYRTIGEAAGGALVMGLL